jgi:hypothetical protein
MWDFWCTKWHWNRLFSESLSCPLSVSLHCSTRSRIHLSPTHYHFSNWQRRHITCLKLLHRALTRSIACFLSFVCSQAFKHNKVFYLRQLRKARCIGPIWAGVTSPFHLRMKKKIQSPKRSIAFVMLGDVQSPESKQSDRNVCKSCNIYSLKFRASS